MESKSLRKQLREHLEAISRIHTALEVLYNEENKAILLKYPFREGDWCHPTSHLYERLMGFLLEAKKSGVKVVGALPPERKTKIVKFVEPKPPKEKSLSEQAKSTKKSKAPRSRKGDTGVKESAPKVRNKAGTSGNGDLGVKAGVAPKTRRTRSDKGKARSKPQE